MCQAFNASLQAVKQRRVPMPKSNKKTRKHRHRDQSTNVSQQAPATSALDASTERIADDVGIDTSVTTIPGASEVPHAATLPTFASTMYPVEPGKRIATDAQGNVLSDKDIAKRNLAARIAAKREERMCGGRMKLRYDKEAAARAKAEAQVHIPTFDDLVIPSLGGDAASAKSGLSGAQRSGGQHAGLRGELSKEEIATMAAECDSVEMLCARAGIPSELVGEVMAMLPYTTTQSATKLATKIVNTTSCRV
jgi:hypothetical protein